MRWQRVWFSGLLLVLAFEPVGARPALPSQQVVAQGENIARGASYTLSPPPNYAGCTDPEANRLTDGRSSAGVMWTQPTAVGWLGAPYVSITVDLGSPRAIGSITLETASDGKGVRWPDSVHIQLSDDGTAFRDIGDLVQIERAAHGPWPTGYAIRRLATRLLHESARFVRAVMIPPQGSLYLFADEIEVFRDPDPPSQPSSAGRAGPDLDQFVRQFKIDRAINHRWEADLASLTQQVASLPVQPFTQRILDGLTRLSNSPPAKDAAPPESIPMDSRHKALFQLQARMWDELGFKGLRVCGGKAWDPLHLISTRPECAQAAIDVHVMRGEYRAAAFSIYNATESERKIRLRFSGLPSSPAPPYIAIAGTEWTETFTGHPVAAALLDAPRDRAGWTLTALPGVVLQAWLTFHATDLPPGDFKGSLIVESDGIGPMSVPVALKIWPLEFPPRTTLAVGGFDYADRVGLGVTSENRDRYVASLRQHMVNAPWATGHVFYATQVAGDPPFVTLDMRLLDEWLARWPNAARYMVFLSTPPSLGGSEAGSGAFERKVRAWLTALAAHLKGKGIPPERFHLLIQDEPMDGKNPAAFIAWAKAVRASDTGMQIWEDPAYVNPASAPAEIFALSNTLSPNRVTWLAHPGVFAPFYANLLQQGHGLDFYSCSGNSKLLDPYSYYRLQAWHCLKVGCGGSFFWSFADNGGTSSWTEYLATSTPYTPLFLSHTRVVSGKQMEAIREGTEDYEYAVMLRRTLERARAGGRRDEAVVSGERILAEAADTVLNAPGAGGIWWADNKDRTIADRVRVSMLGALAALR